MSNELNIRAAKELGCEVVGNFIRIPKSVEAIFTNIETLIQDDQLLLIIDDLKFTTSFDWAMLGVDELVVRGFIVTMFMRQRYPIGGGLPPIQEYVIDIDDKNGKRLVSKTTIVKDKFPAKMTEAWVEVMEVNGE